MTLSHRKLGIAEKKGALSAQKKKEQDDTDLLPSSEQGNHQGRCQQKPGTFLRVNILGKDKAGEQDQDLFIEGHHGGGRLRAESQKKDEHVFVHAGDGGGNLNRNKEKKDVEEGNGKSAFQQHANGYGSQQVSGERNQTGIFSVLAAVFHSLPVDW